jgi:pteridine reductase
MLLMNVLLIYAIMTDTKVALITGAAKRIGACIAEKFHTNNYQVIIHYNRSADAALELVNRLNHVRADSASAIQADLTSSDDVKALANQVISFVGRLDTLVNNASSFYGSIIGKVDDDHWNDLIDSNLRAAFFLSQALNPLLTKHSGSIVNIVDIHGDKPLKGHAVYSIAKAGLKAMTKALAIDLAPKVRVNGVSPGAIIWPARLENAEDESVPLAREIILQQIPLGRLGEMRNIADVCFFLAEEGGYISGQVIRVDGGRHLA